MTGADVQADPPPQPCPQCGDLITAGADECPSCEQSLCPECGAMVGEHWPSCLGCGAKWDLICPECDASVGSRDSQCPECDTLLESDPDEIVPVPPPTPKSSPRPVVTWKGIPACDICGRSDETLRLAVFPFVFSLVIVTFRRAFAGTWCRRHRSLYWALSSLITSMVGWFGIPFGFLYTPLTLYKLSRGGEQLAAENQMLLRVLAERKLREHDAEGAIRCLEESLRLRDSEAVRKELDGLYGVYRPSTYRAPQAKAWPLFAGILCAFALGSAIGLVGFALGAGFAAVVGWVGNILFAIFSWIPLVAMLFLGGLGLAQAIEWALQRGGCRQMRLGIAYSLVMAIVALYGTQQGTSIAELLRLVLSGEAIWSELMSIAVIWTTLTTGGAFVVVDRVQRGGAAAVLYLVVLAVAVVYYAEIGVRTAKGGVRWQQALAEVAAGGEAPSARLLQRGWLAIVAVFVCVACSAVSLPLQLRLWDIADTAGVLVRTLDLTEQGQMDEALDEVETLVRENPDDSYSHFILGMQYEIRGHYDEARDEYEKASELYPISGAPHAALALVHYLTDEMELAEKKLLLADVLGADDGLTQSLLGDVHISMREFARAEEAYLRSMELDPGETWAISGLAAAYSGQGKYEQALELCDLALELDADPADMYIRQGYVHMHQQDLDAASAAFSEASRLAPEASYAYSALSYVHFLKGEMDESLREAETAVRLNPYDQAGQEQLALACHVQGDLDRALAAAKEAVRLGPKDDTAHYILGLCYLDKGEPEKAVEAFETFLDLYWDRAYVRDWKQEAEAYLSVQP